MFAEVVKLSVVVPFHNVERYIEASLESIARQTLRDIMQRPEHRRDAVSRDKAQSLNATVDAGVHPIEPAAKPPARRDKR